MEGCRKVAVLRNEAKVPDSFIFQEKCSNFPEGVRWARAGKKYKTRYFDEVVRIYFSDASDTLSASTRRSGNKKNTYNSLVSCMYCLSESRDAMLRWDRLSYFRTIASLVYFSFRLGLNPFELPFENLPKYEKVFMIILYLPIYIAYLGLK